MYKREVIVKNKTGLHARPASEFINEAKKYKSKIDIVKAGSSDVKNAKSMMSLLTLAIKQNEKIEISADGEDEKVAVDALVKICETDFE